MPPRIKLDRDPLGGLADMFGQMPGNISLLGVSMFSTEYLKILTDISIFTKQVAELVLVQELFKIDFHPPWGDIGQINFSMAMGDTSWLLLNPSLEN